MATPNELVIQEANTVREGFTKREFGKEGSLELPNEWIGLRPTDIIAEKDAEGNNNPFIAKFGENYTAAKKFVETFDAISMIGGDLREYKQFKQMLKYMIVDDPERAEILNEVTLEKIEELEVKLIEGEALNTEEVKVVGASVTESDFDTMSAIQALSKASKRSDTVFDDNTLEFLGSLFEKLHSNKVLTEKLKAVGYNAIDILDNAEFEDDTEFLSGLKNLSAEGIAEFVSFVKLIKPNTEVQIKHLINLAASREPLRAPKKANKLERLEDFAATA